MKNLAKITYLSLIILLTIIGGKTMEAQTIKSLKLNKDQPLTIATSVTFPDKMEALGKYFQRVMPIASQFGFTAPYKLKITDVVGSNSKAEVHDQMGFYTFPDLKSEESFSNHPDWPAIKSTRPDIFKELEIIHFAPQEELEIEFNDDYLYELVVLWTKHPDAMKELGKLAGSELEKAGGKIILKFAPYEYENVEDIEPANLVLFREWKSLDDRNNYLNAMQQYDEISNDAIKKMKIYIARNYTNDELARH